MADKLILDVSTFNSIQSYASAAKVVDGVIIRVGYRGYGSGTLVQDKKFKSNITNFLANGSKVGVYFLTTALNAEEGAQEASYVYSLIKNYKITLPVFVDTEYSNGAHNGRSDKISKANRTAAVKGFCEKIKSYGYTPGVYASDSWFVSQLDLSQLKDYKLWVASYSRAPRNVKGYAGWQYTSSGKVDGIYGRVDLSHWYDEIEPAKPATTTTTTKKKNPYPVPTKTIRYASKGDTVKWLQFELNEEGYKLTVDGDFGSGTLTAVKDYQSTHGLDVDGVVGPNTINALKSNKAKVTKKTTTTKPATVKLDKGTKVTLTKTNLYASSTAGKAARQVSGTFYIWNASVINNRIRVTRIKNSTKATDVTGWVDKSACKA